MNGLALTFDDGPDPSWTTALLDLLARAGSRATFFPIAPSAADQPELMRRIAAEGHAIGLHCDDHVRHSERDAAWCRVDTERALRRLAAVGVRPTRWRTPWGDVAPWTRAIADQHGLTLTGWTVDTHDWRGDGAAEMFTAIEPELIPGSIVLAHDGIGPGARRADARETVDLVARVAVHARRAGLPLVALT